MVNGAVPELVPGMQPDLPQRLFRIDDEPELTILQLIAETERAACLIVRGSTPQSSRNRLVFQPYILHDIHRIVRRVNCDGVQQFSPPFVDFLKGAVYLRKPPVLQNVLRCLRLRIRRAESEAYGFFFIRAKRNFRMEACNRVEPVAGSFPKFPFFHSIGQTLPAVHPEERFLVGIIRGWLQTR